MTFEPPEPIRVALRVCDVFDALGIEHHIGGSVASSILGEPRSTDDVDVVAAIQDHHVNALVARLSPEFFIQEEAVREAVQRFDSFNIIHRELILKVDVFVLKPDPFHRSSMERRLRVIVTPDPERGLSISTAEDTVVQKLAWYRDGGELSSKQWRDIKGVLKVQASRLDRAYMQRWATSVGVSDLLARALTEAGLE